MKRIDEMMENYKTNDDMPLLETTLDKAEKDRILKATLTKIGLSESGYDHEETGGVNRMESNKGFSRKRIFVLALAATLCLGTVFAFATGIFQMSDSMKDFFNIESGEEVKNPVAGTVIDEQVVKDGWTLDVKEVIGDSKNIYVLYDMIAPEGTILGDYQHTFRKQMMNVPGMTSGGWYSAELEDKNLNDNIKSYMFCGNASDGLKGKTVQLTLGDFSKYTVEKGDFELILEGAFSTKFKLDYEVTSRKIDVKESVKIYGGSSTLTNIEVSPISAIVTISGESISKFDETPPPVGYDVSQEIDFSIIMKDGTVLSSPSSGGSSVTGNELISIQNYNELIDIENIKEFKVCGKTIPMN